MTTTVAEVIAGTLKAYGVTHIFGMKDPIDIFHAAEALGLRAVTVHDEKHGAIMAHGLAKATNRPGVCAAMCGPGATNLITGLLEAKQSSIPLVVLVVDIAAAQRGRHAASELDHFAALGPFVKWIGRVETPARAAEMTRHAFRAATSGRGGPAVLLCPRDVMGQIADCAVTVEAGFDSFPSSRPRASAQSVAQAAALLTGAERPVIVAGGGAVLSLAAQSVMTLAEELSAPVATTFNGRGVIADAHPLSLGVLGSSTGGRYGRGRVANEILGEADVAMIVGSRTGQICTSDWTLPGPRARLIHLDVDPLEIGRNFPTEVGLVGDARDSLEDLIEVCRGLGRRAANPAQVARVAALRADWQDEVEGIFRSQQVPIRPERLLHEISTGIAPDARVVTDASYITGWAMSHIDSHGGGNVMFSPRGTGGLGWGLPAAIGVKLAEPGRQVICVTGDGGFGYVLGEMETAARYGVNIVVVVFNNHTLGFQKHFEEKLLGTSWECDLLDVDYAAIARAMHWQAERIVNPEEIGDSLARALAADKPVLLDVIIDPEAIAPIVYLTSDDMP